MGRCHHQFFLCHGDAVVDVPVKNILAIQVLNSNILTIHPCAFAIDQSAIFLRTRTRHALYDYARHATPYILILHTQRQQQVQP